ncbi:hypothetical protein [Acidihalobacter ferrooxydans]|uniref:Uncharacterized protein n=1 Tax=Acidihalobacter ferrooxydans TaxID=1765967 RepID=A0A1P8UFD6_9GAMM|nr:hypothetical protein [Acidihalobacter ferrooxydans]APZ42528.1 hypothetical protein BW247_05000 [Acidihalobacter ferrooxydans]
MRKYIVSYALDYTHDVSVGVEAETKEAALAKAESAFNEGTIWDDTRRIPLLYDDFNESDGNTLEFEAEEVDAWPKPDASVLDLKSRQMALSVCRQIVQSARDGEDKAQAFDRVYESALLALGGA